MRKFIIILTMVSIMTSILLLSTGCFALSKVDQLDGVSTANANSCSQASAQATNFLDGLRGVINERDKALDATNLSEFAKKLAKNDIFIYNQGAVNYQINYTWDDIDTSKADMSLFEHFHCSEEQLREEINSGMLDGRPIARWSDPTKFPFSYTIASVKDIDSNYKIVYNEGHSGLVEENEVLLPKWEYYGEYCANLEEITCTVADMERVLADDYIFQKYCFLGIDYETSSSMHNYFAMVPHAVLPIGLAYYGLLDTTAQKDMSIKIQDIKQGVFGKGGKEYELKVVGYYETPFDRVFEKALSKDADYAAINVYLHNNRVIYFS